MSSSSCYVCGSLETIPNTITLFNGRKVWVCVGCYKTVVPPQGKVEPIVENTGLKELEQAFTKKMGELILPYNEFKQQLRCHVPPKQTLYGEPLEDIDKEKTVDYDRDEFSGDTKGGFYAYEEKNSSQHFAKDFVSDIMLPGHLYDRKESCGKWKLIGCLQKDLHHDGEGYVRKGIMHCYNKGCRICATSTIKREAKSITNRLMTFCNLMKNRKVYLEKNRSRILLHVVVSVPHEDHYLYLTKDGRKQLRKKGIKILKQFDIDGGVTIDHPYRFTKGLESARFSPHFHFILAGWLDGQRVKEIYEKSNWIVTGVSNLDSWHDCYSLSKYLLSHSAVFMKAEGKRSAEHSFRYFGKCHNKKFKVEEVLKHSVTGYDQLDKILFERREIEKKTKDGLIDIPLQSVSYTHSIIQEEIKDSENEFFLDQSNGSITNLSKSLRRFINTESPPIEDNPAIPQSEPPSMEFLQMRFDYGGTSSSIVQSVYVNIIFDTGLEELCPSCTMKMETIVPPEGGWSEKQTEDIAELLKSIPEKVTLPIDDVTEFEYLRNLRFTYLGMTYFDLDGILQHDTGIYERPECLESLNSKLYWNIIKNIDTQKARYLYKIQYGRVPNQEELEQTIRIIRSRKHTESESLLNYC